MTESESEESEHFHFCPTLFMTLSLTKKWKPACRSRKQKVEGLEGSRRNQSHCSFTLFVTGLVLLLLLANPIT